MSGKSSPKSAAGLSPLPGAVQARDERHPACDIGRKGAEVSLDDCGKDSGRRQPHQRGPSVALPIVHARHRRAVRLPLARQALKGDGGGPVDWELVARIDIQDVGLQPLRSAGRCRFFGRQPLGPGNAAASGRGQSARLVAVRAYLHGIVCDGAACKQQRPHQQQTSHLRPPIVVLGNRTRYQPRGTAA